MPSCTAVARVQGVFLFQGCSLTLRRPRLLGGLCVNTFKGNIRPFYVWGIGVFSSLTHPTYENHQFFLLKNTRARTLSRSGVRIFLGVASIMKTPVGNFWKIIHFWIKTDAIWGFVHGPQVQNCRFSRRLPTYRSKRGCHAPVGWVRVRGSDQRTPPL